MIWDALGLWAVNTDIVPTSLAFNSLHLGKRSHGNMFDTAVQLLSIGNLTKSLLPQSPAPQSVTPALIIFAIKVAFAELVDFLSGKKNPGSGWWHIGRCAPLLLWRPIWYLDAFHEADLSMERHTDWLQAVSQVQGAKGGDTYKRRPLSIGPVAFIWHLGRFRLDVCHV